MNNCRVKRGGVRTSYRFRPVWERSGCGRVGDVVPCHGGSSFGLCLGRSRIPGKRGCLWRPTRLRPLSGVGTDLFSKPNCLCLGGFWGGIWFWVHPVLRRYLPSKMSSKDQRTTVVGEVLRGVTRVTFAERLVHLSSHDVGVTTR